MKDFNTSGFIHKMLLSIILIFSLSQFGAAQRFSGTAVFGLNLAQIDGDNLAGFSKMGWTGGVKLAYSIKEFSDINIELLYSQRGSTSGFGFGNKGDNYVDLQYLEIPLYVNIKDWFKAEDNFHKVKAHAGISYSYLFGVESFISGVSGNIDNYNKNNINILAGVHYAFTKNMGITLRYTRGLNSLTETRAISYFITLRTDYTF